MARTFTEIFDSIKVKYVAERAAAGLVYDDPALWRKVNIKRLLFYVVAWAAFIMELLFDAHTAEVNADLERLRPGSIGWYADMCLKFQYGFPLIAGTDNFDNTGYTDAQIEASKVVKYAAVQRLVDESGYVLFLRIKLAGENGNELAQLSDDVVDAFREYLDQAQPAGDNLTVISRPADKLKMTWQIYFDALILKEDGSRHDGGALTPVQDAILDYLKTGLPFNGKYSITSHIDRVQQVPGVITPRVLACSASSQDLPYESISEYYQPFAGWLRFDDIELDLNIEFIPG